MVGARLLPDSQVGLLGYGRVSLVDDWELSYALGVSNGRTDLIAYEDLDDNKAITARLALTYRGLGELTLAARFTPAPPPTTRAPSTSTAPHRRAAKTSSIKSKNAATPSIYAGSKTISTCKPKPSSTTASSPNAGDRA